jgi:hypothetical protein
VSLQLQAVPLCDRTTSVIRHNLRPTGDTAVYTQQLLITQHSVIFSSIAEFRNTDKKEHIILLICKEIQRDRVQSHL